MVFTRHKIYFYITRSYSLLNDFRPFYNRYTIRNNATSIFPITSLSSTFTMLKMLIYSFIGLISSLISMFTLTDPLTQTLCTQMAFIRYITLNTNQFRTPLFYRQPFYCLILHLWSKLHQFGFKVVSLIRPTMSVSSQIMPTFHIYLGNIPFQFSANSGRIYSKFMGHHFLFHSCLNKGFNLISLFQTELCIFFRHKQSKDCTTRSNGKIP